MSFWRLKSRLRRQAVTLPDPVTPDMEPQPLEGYSDALYYHPNQKVSFYIKALHPNNLLQLQYLSGGKDWTTLAEHSFGQVLPPETLEEAQQGCQWGVTWQYHLPLSAKQGYYRVVLSNQALADTSEIHFIVGQTTSNARVAVLAPTTTWLAYNAYGGQSLYRNAISAEPVYFVSAQRPNTALTYQAAQSMQHSLQIETNIFYWMSLHAHADLLPDYFLQAQPQALQQYRVVVLAYHAEYFSQEMYQTLRNLVFQEQKSLLALGGNQVYWQVRWHQNFTQLECRKDATPFQETEEPGKLFRHTPQPEVRLLGVQFSDSGMGTFAPYKVLNPEHWLLIGCAVEKGQLFGQTGVDGKPICGDETDKTTWGTAHNTVVLARGMNKTTAATEMEIFDPANPAWDGSGGGEIAFTSLSENHGVLSTGSIHSGAGLGHDEVFTGLIRNFMQKYAGNASHGTTSAEIAAETAS